MGPEENPCSGLVSLKIPETLLEATAFNGNHIRVRASMVRPAR